MLWRWWRGGYRRQRWAWTPGLGGEFLSGWGSSEGAQTCEECAQTTINRAETPKPAEYGAAWA